jgi:hypothetical protein
MIKDLEDVMCVKGLEVERVYCIIWGEESNVLKRVM